MDRSSSSKSSVGASPNVVGAPPALPTPRESRSSIRYALDSEVVFAWTDRRNDRREARGRTRDISPKGAYVIAVVCPQPGTDISITMYLPALSSHARGLRIECTGRVLRVESPGSGEASSGFAVVNDRVALCTQ